MVGSPCYRQGHQIQKNHPSMTTQTLQSQFLQSDSEQTSEIFNEYLRGSVRLALFELMQQEVHELCGPSHARGHASCKRRAGSEQGIGYINGKKEPLLRPRVRRQNDDGSEEEVELKSYQAARQINNVSQDVARLLLEGVCTRGAARLSDSSIGKSTISEQWAERSAEKLVEFRSKALKEDGYLVIMLDGIHLSREQTAIVALGIDAEGHKHMLDFNVGSSETYEVVNDLLKRLRKRGLKSAAKRFLAVLDGSAALEKALLAHYPDAILQRCQIHKERNLRSYLSKRDHGELARLFDRLRKAQGKQASHEAYKAISDFLEDKNSAAFASLQEAGEDQLTALQSLGLPATLNRSLLSTNIIENSILNIRRRMSRVHRWRTATKGKKETMADCYLAAGLTYAQNTFRRIHGYGDLDKLVQALNKD